METRTRIHLSIAASLAISVVIVSIFISVVRVMDKEVVRRRVYEEIREKTHALTVLTAGFQSPPDPSQVHQIRETRRSLELLLGTVTSLSPDEEALKEELLANFRDLASSLEKLLSADREMAGRMQVERQDILVSQLWMKTQFISDDIYRLMQISRSRVASAQQDALVSLVALVVLLLLMNAAVSYLTGRNIVRIQEGLHRAVEEKEDLLKELAHRTKNNLQVIGSLLRLQTAYSTDEAFRAALSDIENRIYAMALVHEKLYQSGNFSALNMKDYLRDLMTSLLSTHQGADGPVRPDLNVDGIALSTDAALPFGLIISELVSNSMKHAFAGGKDGSIFLSLRRNAETIELRYRDDGPGPPRDIDLSRIQSLGLKLVNNLAVRQLRGTMEIQRDPVSEYVFTFRDLEQAGEAHP